MFDINRYIFKSCTISCNRSIYLFDFSRVLKSRKQPIIKKYYFSDKFSTASFRYVLPCQGARVTRVFCFCFERYRILLFFPGKYPTLPNKVGRTLTPHFVLPCSIPPFAKAPKTETLRP